MRSSSFDKEKTTKLSPLVFVSVISEGKEVKTFQKEKSMPPAAMAGT